jgi:hypothetical protein
MRCSPSRKALEAKGNSLPWECGSQFAAEPFRRPAILLSLNFFHTDANTLLWPWAVGQRQHVGPQRSGEHPPTSFPVLP